MAEGFCVFFSSQTKSAKSFCLFQILPHKCPKSRLKKEEQKFEQALGNQHERQVGNKKAKIGQLQTSIEKKEAQLKKLQAEVAKHNEQINTLQSEIQQAVSKIADTKNDFIASYNSLVNQIQQDVKNINEHL